MAKKLIKYHDNINFHVVGNYSKDDIPIESLEKHISFYGLRSEGWFDQFYQDKDLILSPNVPFVLRKGSFDGFPTACCTEAGLHKVAMFCTDQLKLNSEFKNGEDIVIIPHNEDKIVDIVLSYYNNPLLLKHIGECGSHKIRLIYCYDKQILPRIEILRQEIEKSKSYQND